jgi:hypothetical protein
MKYKLILGSLSLLLISQILGFSNTSYNESINQQHKNQSKTPVSTSIDKTISKKKPKAIALIDKNRKIIRTKSCKLIKFDAKDSFDPDGDDKKLKYEWSNTDANTISKNSSFVHKYDKKGIYEATLKVTDEQKLSSIDRVCILVDITKHEIPLIAKAGKDQEVRKHHKIKLNGRAICRDDIVDFEWREGKNILSNKQSFEQNLEKGKHTLQLIIKDKLGNEAIDSVVISVI